MKKKFLSILILLSVSSILFAAPKAKKYDYVNPEAKKTTNWIKSGIWRYVKLDSKTCIIVDVDISQLNIIYDQGDSSPDLYIPSSLDGLTVTELHSFIFSWSPINGAIPSEIERIHIPQTITFISQNAFTFIEDGARNLQLVLDGDNPNYEIYDNGLYSKYDHALIVAFHSFDKSNDYDYYYDDYNSDSSFVTAPFTKIISKNAFNNLSSVTEIHLNEGLEIMEENFFGDIWCYRNIYMVIPASVKSLPVGVYPKGIYIDNANPNYEEDDGCIYDKRTKTLIGMCINNSLTDLSIKEGTVCVEDINLGFYFDKMTSIYFPDSVKEIKIYALPDSVNTIRLPPKLEDLRFYHSSIKELPETLKFYRGEKPIKINKKNPYLKIEKGMLLSKDGTILYQIFDDRNTEKLVIPETVKIIKENYVYAENARELVLPENLEEMPASFLFSNFSKTLKVRIPAKTKLILDENDYFTLERKYDIQIDSKNPYYEIKDDFFYEKQNGILLGYFPKEEIKNIVIPEFILDCSYTFISSQSIESFKITNHKTIPPKNFSWGDYEDNQFEVIVPVGSAAARLLKAFGHSYTTFMPKKK